MSWPVGTEQIVVGLGRCNVDTICIEPPRGMTLHCQEHWQVLVTQMLGGTLIEFKINQVNLIAKLNSAKFGFEPLTFESSN